MNGFYNFSIRQMIVTAIAAIILGIIMLVHPAGTLALMSGTFWSVQLVLTLFILIYIISDMVRNAKNGSLWATIFSATLGLLAIAFLWLLDISFIYFIIAFFFILTGILEIGASFGAIYSKFFIFLLGIINVMIGAAIIKHPMIMPLLIAWYILFWGVSRLILAVEIHTLMKKV